MQITLSVAFLVTIAMMACGPLATTSKPDSGTSPQQPTESGPALLLDEKSAILILQVYLQDCLHGWDSVYANRVRKQMRTPPATLTSFERQKVSVKVNARRRAELRGTVFPTSTPLPSPTPLPPDLLRLSPSAQEKKSWLIDLATGTAGAFAWSASYHGVTGVPRSYTRTRTAIEAETWVVVGPGVERSDTQLATPGRWKVYAGVEQVDYVDAPARLALEEYDSYHSCP